MTDVRGIDAAPFAVSIEGVSKRYGGAAAIDGLTLEVKAGEVVAIAGVAGMLGWRCLGPDLRGRRLLTTSGGFADVYRAYSAALQRTVVLKMLKRDGLQDRDVQAKFVNEARILHAIHITFNGRAPVVQCYGTGTDHGRPYLVLEYLAGPSLRRYLSRQQPTPGQVIHLLRQIASALSCAHRLDVIHRDVDPGNVLFCDRRSGTVKLIDVGVARDPALITMNPALFGKLWYMAPEQSLSGARLTPMADIYSLGIMAFEMLTGRVPFNDRDPGRILQAHRARPCPPITAPGVPTALAALVAAMLCKDPATRPPAAMVHHQLEALQRTTGAGWAT